jgi:hypothetical protein
MDKYYNQFDYKKKYKDIMFRAAKGLQSTELNELQAMLRHEFNTVVNTLYGDGSVLRGGTVTVNDKNIHISDSVILAKNWTHIIPETQLTITANGTEIIGIALKESEVTENEDESLRDPAVGTRNYKEPGAGRLKVDSRFCLEGDKKDGEQFFPIFTFKDGVFISNQKIAPELEGARNMIARYDNNSNGSYVISGLEMTYDSDDNATQRHKFNVSSGEGHVEGYEVIFQYDRPLYLPFNKDTKSVEAEPHTFTADGEYPLRNNPINQVTRVLGVKKTTENVNHGNFLGAKDKLSKTPVVKVISVKQGGTTYTSPADYTVNGDSLDWSPSGQEPAPGSTYQVEYQYTTTEIPASIDSTRKKITVNGLDAGTLFYVSYSYFIPRIDRILLTRDGEFKILQGTPTDNNPKAPAHTTLLSLGTIKVLSGAKPEVTLDFYRAFKMSDIQSLFNAVSEIKYNVARLALQENIQQMEPSSVKKNTFVDPFYDNDLRDMGKMQNAFINRQELNLRVNYDVSNISLGKTIHLPFTEAVHIKNDSQTKSRKINEFLFLTPPDPQVTLSPDVYRWVAEVTFSQIWTQGRWNGSYVNSTQSAANKTVEIPQIDIKIRGKGFNAGESINIVFDSRAPIVRSADGNGAIDTTIQVPAGVTSGSKSIVITGQQSGATTTLVFTATPLVEHRQTVNVWRPRRDPLGQTFISNKPFFLTSAEVMVKALPNDYIEIGVCETTAGVPDRNKILTLKRLPKADITLNAWTKFSLDAPLYITEGTEYALLVITNDAVAEVSVSELGQFDEVNKRWVSSQAYADGVLLNSSNLSTWSPLQKEDLTFHINKGIFEDHKTFKFDQITVTDITDLMLLADIDLYPDTSISFEATLVDRANEKVTITPFTPTYITKYTGKVEVEASLKSINSDLTPVILPNIQLGYGKVVTPSTYISRQFKTDGTKIKVFLETYEPSGASIKVFYETTQDNFVELPRKTNDAVNLGDGWVDMPYVIEGASVDATRIKIVMETTDSNLRPRVKNLRSYVLA